MHGLYTNRGFEMEYEGYEIAVLMDEDSILGYQDDNIDVDARV